VELDHQPFNAPIPIIAKKWDVNVTVFSIRSVMPAAGLVAATR
jgi:hypothetical protein